MGTIGENPYLPCEPVVFLDELWAVLDVIRVREGNWVSARACPSGAALLHPPVRPWHGELANSDGRGDGSMVDWGDVVDAGSLPCRLLAGRIEVVS